MLEGQHMTSLFLFFLKYNEIKIKKGRCHLYTHTPSYDKMICGMEQDAAGPSQQ